MRLILAVSLCLFSLVHAEYSDSGWINVELFHALDGDNFLPRGNITITNLNTGALTMNQETLEDQEKLLLKDLAQRNKFYRLKATVVGADGQKYTYLTSSKACALFRSQLTDQIFVNLDHTGFVVGISQMVSSNGAECGGISKHELDAIEEFNTEVFVKLMEVAPVPDTASFLNKIEQERMARERGETKDNRGFFAKYWMYIVPVAILVLVSGATNPEAQNGGGAR